MNAPVRTRGSVPAIPGPPTSPRPNTITDTWGFWLLDPSTGTVVGREGPLGRGRVMSATRLGEYSNSQWHDLKPATVVVDTWGFQLMDPATQTVVGRDRISVQRCLTARWTEDTGGFGRA
jgi:hypothetical protein